jgi:hypothetical protein
MREPITIMDISGISGTNLSVWVKEGETLVAKCVPKKVKVEKRKNLGLSQNPALKTGF